MFIINFILWILLGGIAGYVASMIMGTNKTQGPLMDVVIGIVGSFLGGFLAGNLLGIGGGIRDGINLIGIIVAIAGACLLIFLLRLIRR